MWLRLRTGIPAYEELAMRNYSAFYYTATAWMALDDERERMTVGHHPQPEIFFLRLQSVIEQAKAVPGCARTILHRLGQAPNFPKHPERLYQTVSDYCNAFIHNPVLGRATTYSRELLPPHNRVSKKGKILLWSEAVTIPETELVDGIAFCEDLWNKFVSFLQKQSEALAREFTLVRDEEQFRTDLGLHTLLPIQISPSPELSLNAIAPSGIFFARSDTR